MSKKIEWQLERIADWIENIEAEIDEIRDQQFVFQVAAKNTNYDEEFFKQVAEMRAVAQYAHDSDYVRQQQCKAVLKLRNRFGHEFELNNLKKEQNED